MASTTTSYMSRTLCVQQQSPQTLASTTTPLLYPDVQSALRCLASSSGTALTADASITSSSSNSSSNSMAYNHLTAGTLQMLEDRQGHAAGHLRLPQPQQQQVRLVHLLMDASSAQSLANSIKAEGALLQISSSGLVPRQLSSPSCLRLSASTSASTTGEATEEDEDDDEDDGDADEPIPRMMMMMTPNSTPPPPEADSFGTGAGAGAGATATGDEDPQMCTICGKQWLDRAQFNAHIRAHLKEKLCNRNRGSGGNCDFSPELPHHHHQHQRRWRPSSGPSSPAAAQPVVLAPQPEGLVSPPMLVVATSLPATVRLPTTPLPRMAAPTPFSASGPPAVGFLPRSRPDLDSLLKAMDTPMVTTSTATAMLMMQPPPPPTTMTTTRVMQELAACRPIPPSPPPQPPLQPPLQPHHHHHHLQRRELLPPPPPYGSTASGLGEGPGSRVGALLLEKRLLMPPTSARLTPPPPYGSVTGANSLAAPTATSPSSPPSSVQAASEASPVRVAGSSLLLSTPGASSSVKPGHQDLVEDERMAEDPEMSHEMELNRIDFKNHISSILDQIETEFELNSTACGSVGLHDLWLDTPPDSDCENNNNNNVATNAGNGGAASAAGDDGPVLNHPGSQSMLMISQQQQQPMLVQQQPFQQQQVVMLLSHHHHQRHREHHQGQPGSNDNVVKTCPTEVAPSEVRKGYGGNKGTAPAGKLASPSATAGTAPAATKKPKAKRNSSTNFVCYVCHKGFVQKSHLTRHLKIHGIYKTQPHQQLQYHVVAKGLGNLNSGDAKAAATMVKAAKAAGGRTRVKKRLNCVKCTDTFGSMTRLQEHLLNCHANEALITVEPGPPVPTKLCPTTTFKPPEKQQHLPEQLRPPPNISELLATSIAAPLPVIAQLCPPQVTFCLDVVAPSATIIKEEQSEGCGDDDDDDDLNNIFMQTDLPPAVMMSPGAGVKGEVGVSGQDVEVCGAPPQEKALKGCGAGTRAKAPMDTLISSVCVEANNNNSSSSVANCSQGGGNSDMLVGDSLVDLAETAFFDGDDDFCSLDDLF